MKNLIIAIIAATLISTTTAHADEVDEASISDTVVALYVEQSAALISGNCKHTSFWGDDPDSYCYRVQVMGLGTYYRITLSIGEDYLTQPGRMKTAHDEWANHSLDAIHAKGVGMSVFREIRLKVHAELRAEGLIK